MKFLLTGLPGVGKSTIVEKVRNSLECVGVLAREHRKNGERVGFITESWRGESKPFMHKTNQPSKNSIGGPSNWYDVDIDVLDTFVVPELRLASRKEPTMLYIDEIGRAQMKSAAFISLIRTLLLEPKRHILATIVYADDLHSPSLEFKRYPDICLLEVTQKNREALPPILISAFKNAELFKKLNHQHQQKIFTLLKQFIEKEQYISAEKIFTHALDYLINKKVMLLTEKDSVAQYLVHGRTKDHKVDYHHNTKTMNCDCDLSTGSGEYAGCSQTCSHQIAIFLMNIPAPAKSFFESKQNGKPETPQHEQASLPAYRSRL